MPAADAAPEEGVYGERFDASLPRKEAPPMDPGASRLAASLVAAEPSPLTISPGARRDGALGRDPVSGERPPQPRSVSAEEAIPGEPADPRALQYWRGRLELARWEGNYSGLDTRLRGNPQLALQLAPDLEDRDIRGLYRSSIGQIPYVGTTHIYDFTRANELTQAIVATRDPTLQARFFREAVTFFDEADYGRDDELSTGDSFADFRVQTGALLLQDPRAVTAELRGRYTLGGRDGDASGEALSRYFEETLNEIATDPGSERVRAVVGDYIEGVRLPPLPEAWDGLEPWQQRFVEENIPDLAGAAWTGEDPTGYLGFMIDPVTPGNLGYAAGALDQAMRDVSADARAKAELISGVLGAALKLVPNPAATAGQLVRGAVGAVQSRAVSTGTDFIEDQLTAWFDDSSELGPLAKFMWPGYLDEEGSYHPTPSANLLVGGRDPEDSFNGAYNTVYVRNQ